MDEEKGFPNICP